jgi:hypothetical protein
MVYIAYAKYEAYGYTNDGSKITGSGSATACGKDYIEAYYLAENIAKQIAEKDPNGIYMDTEVVHQASAIHIPTDAHLKAFWDNLENKTKKIFFVRNYDGKNYVVGSQTYWGYKKYELNWQKESYKLSLEEANKLAKTLAFEAPNGIYVPNDLWS